ncbi:unnamed protein product [Brassica oleracea]
MDRCVFRSGVVISATAFTVTEVVNKFLTVLMNVLIWDKHASPQSVTVAKKPTSGQAQVLNNSEKVNEESVELIPGKVATNV